LLDPLKKFEVYGTLAKEIVHEALFMVYENNCKPYKEGDVERMKEYKRVVVVSEERKGIEPVFNRALSYLNSQVLKEAEAAVRPAYADALYANNETKRKELEAYYHELYGYFRGRIVPDVEQALMELRNAAKELQEKHGVPMNAEDAKYFLNLERRHKMLWVRSILVVLFLGFVASGLYFMCTKIA
jgi:type VI protein secretion system component VasK